MKRRSHPLATRPMIAAGLVAASLFAGSAAAQPAPEGAPQGDASPPPTGSSPWLEPAAAPTAPPGDAPSADPVPLGAPPTAAAPPGANAAVDAPAMQPPPPALGSPATPPGGAAAAPVPAAFDEDADDDDPASWDHLPRYPQRHLGFEAGFRVVAPADPSYDPYASSDALAAFALAATWSPIEIDPLTLGLIGEWDGGGSTGTARGLETSLTVHRASVGVQGRVALSRRIHLQAKVAPALLLAYGSIHDTSLDRTLDATGATWGVDATGGAAFLIARAGHPDATAFRVWIVGEVGWAFSGAADMEFSPGEDDEDPRRFGSVALPALDTSGLVNRIAVAVTF